MVVLHEIIVLIMSSYSECFRMLLLLHLLLLFEVLLVREIPILFCGVVEMRVRIVGIRVVFNHVELCVVVFLFLNCADRVVRLLSG